MTLVSRPLRLRAIRASQMLDFTEIAALITGCYMALQIWYGHGCMTLVPGPSYWGVEFQFLAGGGKPTRTRGSKCEKRRPCSRAPGAGAVCIFGVPHGSATGDR
jgi:hypothetical protein